MFAFAIATGLQSVGADHFPARAFFDDQMIANLIERIDIAFERVRCGQAFAQFEVEDLKP